MRWTLFIITNYIDRFVFRSALREDRISDLIATSCLIMISDFMDILAAIVTLLLILYVSKIEVILYENAHMIEPKVEQTEIFKTLNT